MKYVIANWKMNMDVNGVKEWLEKFSLLQKKAQDNVAIVLAPTFVHLPLVAKNLEHFGNSLSLSAQDISAGKKGALTGDVAAFQIKDFCTYSIVGHSERKEQRDVVYTKRDLCLEEGITPIVCFTTIDQLKDSYVEGALVTWEDPDNISKGGVYNEKDPNDIANTFKEFEKILPGVEILYGGSVNRNNVENLVKIPNIGGFILGTASLDPAHYQDLISAFS